MVKTENAPGRVGHSWRRPKDAGGGGGWGAFGAPHGVGRVASSALPTLHTPRSWPGCRKLGTPCHWVSFGHRLGHREPPGYGEPRRHRGVPSGSRGQSCTEPRPRQATQGPTSDNQSPHDPQMASCRWGSCLPWGWGGTHRDPSQNSRSAAPLFPRLGATSGSSCPFSLPKKPSTVPASLGQDLRPLTHQWMLVPPTQRRSEPGLGRGLEAGAGDPSASRRRAGQRGLARSGVRSLELGLKSLLS